MAIAWLNMTAELGLGHHIEAVMLLSPHLTINQQ